MQTLYDVLVVVHVISLAMALAGWAMTLRAPHVNGLLSWGVTVAFVLGVVLTGIGSASDAVADPDNVKVAVKLVIGLAAVGLAHATRRRPAPNPLAHVVAALIVVNVVIAYAW